MTNSTSILDSGSLGLGIGIVCIGVGVCAVSMCVNSVKQCVCCLLTPIHAMMWCCGSKS
jgi:hypothetical protein